MNFLQAILEYDFVQRAIFIGILCSFLSATLGVFVVINHLSSFGGAVSHSLLGGLGVASYISTIQVFSFITPIWGSFTIALTLPFLIEWMNHYDRSDSILNVIWALGMSVGNIFISFSHGYQRDLMSYLFGNILLTTQQDILFLGVFTFIVVTLFLLFKPQIFMLSFDKDWFLLRYPYLLKWTQRVILCTLSLGVVLLSRIVGIILVISLLTLPASIANLYTFQSARLSFIAFLISLIGFFIGFYGSYLFDLPLGAMIVAILGIIYFSSLIIVKFR